MSHACGKLFMNQKRSDFFFGRILWHSHQWVKKLRFKITDFRLWRKVNSTGKKRSKSRFIFRKWPVLNIFSEYPVLVIDFSFDRRIAEIVSQSRLLHRPKITLSTVMTNHFAFCQLFPPRLVHHVKWLWLRRILGTTSSFSDQPTGRPW